MVDPLAKMEVRKDGYYVLARYSKRGKFRVVEKWNVEHFALASVDDLEHDDQYRHRLLRETVDWDFIENDVKKPWQRQPREHIEPVHFSFED